MNTLGKVIGTGLVGLLAGCSNYTPRRYVSAETLHNVRETEWEYSPEAMKKREKEFLSRLLERDIKAELDGFIKNVKDGYYKDYTSEPTIEESFLNYPENVNKIAGALLEYDFPFLGECLFGIYGSVDNISVRNIAHDCKYVNAFRKLVENNGDRTDLSNLLETVLLNTVSKDEDFYAELYALLLENKVSQYDGYLLDLLEGAVDRIVDPKNIQCSRNNLIALTHTHPGMSGRCFSEDDKNTLISNAFGYFNGKLTYQVFENNVSKSSTRRMIMVDITDKSLIFNLDLATARLNALNAGPMGIERFTKHTYLSFGHLMRAIKNKTLSATERNAIEDTIGYLYDKLNNRFKYIEHKMRVGIQEETFLEKLDQIVIENNFVIPIDQEVDANLKRYRESIKIIQTRPVSDNKRLKYPTFEKEVVSNPNEITKPIIEIHESKPNLVDKVNEDNNQVTSTKQSEKHTDKATNYVPVQPDLVDRVKEDNNSGSLLNYWPCCAVPVAGLALLFGLIYLAARRNRDEQGNTQKTL